MTLGPIMEHITEDEVTQIIDDLLAHQSQTQADRPVTEILRSIDQTVSRWLDPTSPERQEAEHQLPRTTGMSVQMLRHVLPLIFSEYTGKKLERLCALELGTKDVLDSFVPMTSGHKKAVGPSLIINILAGNIPGAGLDSVLYSLIVKSATLVKASSVENILPEIFIRSLRKVDPVLGSNVAVTTWPGGNQKLEEHTFGRADLVVASGSVQSLSAIRKIAAQKLIGYGHKVSFSLIAKKEIAQVEELARETAYDIALFDQKGCLSPQVIYIIEGGSLTSGAFTECLAERLRDWESLLPRGTAPATTNHQIRKAREEAEWKMLAGKDVTLHASGKGFDWTVIYDNDPTFVPSETYRTIRVKPLNTLFQLREILAPWKPYLECVGLAARDEEYAAIADFLGGIGVSRICPLGKMQTPPIGWRHGGRPRLADFVRWVGLEIQ